LHSRTEKAASPEETLMSETKRLKKFVGREVVLDTDADFLYVGTLSGADDVFYELADADAHDSRTTSTTRDMYIINVRKYGVKKNRDRVLVRRDRVVSLSLLSDITQY
jgi:small nuclear ribonucleoprotein (snRNP)-like protein